MQYSMLMFNEPINNTQFHAGQKIVKLQIVGGT